MIADALPVDPSSLSASGMLIVSITAQIITFLGVVIGVTVGFLRESRTRRWQREDREERIKTADTLAKMTITTAKTLENHTTMVVGDLQKTSAMKADAVQASLVHLAADVLATKHAAGDAYKEANHVNMKLAAIGQGNIDQGNRQASMMRDIVILVQNAVSKELDRRTGSRGQPS